MNKKSNDKTEKIIEGKGCVKDAHKSDR